MSWNVGVSGAFKEVAAPSVGVGGAWKLVQSGWVGVGGAWKKFFDALRAVISGQFVTGNSSASYRLRDDGVALTGSNGSFTSIPGEWLAAGTVADFDGRATSATGDTGSVSGGFDNWINLAGTRTWAITASGGQFHTCTFTVEIRRAADQVTIATAEVTLEADNT
jgi:hypothetical protein